MKNCFWLTQSKQVTNGQIASICFFLVHKSNVGEKSISTKFFKQVILTSVLTVAATGNKISTNKPANACFISLSLTSVIQIIREERK